jgi:hypothetical protein
LSGVSIATPEKFTAENAESAERRPEWASIHAEKLFDSTDPIEVFSTTCSWTCFLFSSALFALSAVNNSGE